MSGYGSFRSTGSMGVDPSVSSSSRDSTASSTTPLTANSSNSEVQMKRFENQQQHNNNNNNNNNHNHKNNLHLPTANQSHTSTSTPRFTYSSTTPYTDDDDDDDNDNHHHRKAPGSLSSYATGYASSTASSTSSSKTNSIFSYSSTAFQQNLVIERKGLLRILDRRIERARRCRSVPASLAVYAVFIAALLTHAPVGPSYDFETSLMTEIVDTSGFRDIILTSNGWYPWFSSAFLPTVLSSTGGLSMLPSSSSSETVSSWDPSFDFLGGAYDDYYYAPSYTALSSPGRLINNHGLILGGIRLYQKRAAPVSCPDPSLNQLYNDTCYDPSVANLLPYGSNLTAAAETGVTSAFVPSSTMDDKQGQVFQLYFNALDDLFTAQSMVQGLQESSWIDESTSVIGIQLTVYNGQINYFGTIELESIFHFGGRISNTAKVGSFNGAPYLNRDGIYLLDIIVIVYVLYLVRSLLLKALRSCAPRRKSSALNTNGSTHSLSDPSNPDPVETCCSRSLSFFNVWRILDLGALASLLATIISWAIFASKLFTVRTAISTDKNASPTNYAGESHANTAINILIAHELHQTWKVCSVIALIFLSLRLFKYFQFQPRLAVMTDSLIMAFSDAVHFALLFAVLLCCYGTWGYYMFGTQANDWSTINNSIVSVFRYMMYDYDLSAMGATFPTMANLFNASFMLIVTNLTLWMFLAIILESYTEIRAKSHDAPSVVEESIALLKALPGMIAIPYWLGGKNQREPSWVEVRRCIRVGMLSGKLLIAPIDLQRTTGLSMESSVTLIMEARKEEMNEITQAAHSAEQEALTNAMIAFTKTAAIEAYTTGEMMNTLPTTVQEDIYTVSKAFNIPLISVSGSSLSSFDTSSSSSLTTGNLSSVYGIPDIQPLLTRIEQIHSHLLLYKKLHDSNGSNTNSHNKQDTAGMFMFPVRNTNNPNTNTNDGTGNGINDYPPRTI